LNSQWLPKENDVLSEYVPVRFFPETMREIDKILRKKESRDRWKNRGEFVRAAVIHFLACNPGVKR